MLNEFFNTCSHDKTVHFNGNTQFQQRNLVEISDEKPLKPIFKCNNNVHVLLDVYGKCIVKFIYMF